MSNRLHGIEVANVDNGERPIEVQRMSTVGVVGTAPEADPNVFPLNKPVLLLGRDAKKIAALGARGTLPWSLDAIFDQYGAAVVVIRVARAATPTTSVLVSCQKQRVAVNSEIINRAADTDTDPLGNADVIQVSAVRMGDTVYEKGVDWQRTGDNIKWLSIQETESVTRRIGTTDPLAHDDTALSVEKVFLGTTIYVQGTDYNWSELGIEWLPDGESPAKGEEYYVLYTHGKRPSEANPYEVDYSYYQNGFAENEVVNRSAGDYDELTYSNILRVRSVKSGTTIYVKGTDWNVSADGSGIDWVRNAEVETVTRSATSLDALSNAGVLEITEVSQGGNQYTVDVDWQQNGNQVEWLGGASPAEGSDYTVTYSWGVRPADEQDYTVTYDYRTGESTAMSKVIGGVKIDTGTYEGMYALLGAESELRLSPRILIAPGFTQYEPVVAEFVGIADRLRSVIIADGPNTSDTDALGYRDSFGNKRVYLVDPWVRFYNAQLGIEDVQPTSARVAGIINRVDAESGVWHSPSNKEMYGITGLGRPIDFIMGERNCVAQYLNENEVATVIQSDGYYLWGNRTCSPDPRYAFLAHVRVDDLIEVSMLKALRWAVDRPMTPAFFEDVSGSVAAFLRNLAARGAIYIGTQSPVWIDPQLNTPDQLAMGKVTFNFDYAHTPIAEHIIFQRFINLDYLKSIFEQSNLTRL